jgi:hypothetical protein
MTTPPMLDQQLMDYSGEHLMHELSMFWELAAILPGKKASTETSALVESFGVHLRNLIDFFYRPGQKDDVTAQDFLEQPTSWKPVEPSSLTAAHVRANKELHHLTQARISGSPPQKAWDTRGLRDEIEVVAKEFALNASPKKLHKKVIEFLQRPSGEMLFWIGDNVSHSNVASQAMSPGAVAISPVANNTTHTQIIQQTSLKKS